MEWKKESIRLSREAETDVFITELSPELREAIVKEHPGAKPKAFAIMDGQDVCDFFDTREEAEANLYKYEENTGEVTEEEKLAYLLKRSSEVHWGIKQNYDLFTQHEAQEIYG